MNNKFILKNKFDNRAIFELELMINDYENKFNNIIDTYNLRIKEQNEEISQITSNY